MESIHSKNISTKERDFFLLAAKSNLTPQIIECKPENEGRYMLVTKEYSESVFDILHDKSRNTEDKIHEWTFTLEEVKRLIQKLHSIDILHNDLSEDNIVYNKITSTVKLIDFGMSRFISSIGDEEIDDMVENLYEGIRYAKDEAEYPSKIEYLKAVELGIIDFLLDVGIRRITKN